MMGSITGFITGGLTSKACFVAGTVILTVAGKKAIEEIQVGDKVWAWDEKTGDVAVKEVVQTYINESKELIHVFVEGEDLGKATKSNEQTVINLVLQTFGG